MSATPYLVREILEYSDGTRKVVNFKPIEPMSDDGNQPADVAPEAEVPAEAEAPVEAPVEEAPAEAPAEAVAEEEAE